MADGKKVKESSLAESDISALTMANLDRNLIFNNHPEIYDPIFLHRVTIRILIVTDGSLGFGINGFGLTELIAALQEDLGLYAQVAITKAHRRNDPDANISSFQFHQTYNGHPLSFYDELWLFGFEREDLQAISEAELSAIVAFMDSGKGVFATGDHVAMGKSMCGRIPRVRTMRRWYYPNTSAEGDLPAPPGDPVTLGSSPSDINVLVNRHDTLQQGHDGGSSNAYQFDDQSDDVPQPLQIVWNYLPTSNLFFKRRYPHPLLCARNGVIDVLPDHPHEGWCQVPPDLNKVYTINGSAYTEYPELSSGVKLSPVLAARGTVIGGHTTDEVAIGQNGIKPAVNAKTFGVISAYDGHRIPGLNIGRVACDSTWHHFVNVNLIGQPGASTAIKQQGFKATATGQAELDRIKAYYRNIAIWLAPKNKQKAMFKRVLWAARYEYPLAEELAVLTTPRALEGLSVKDVLDVGAISRNAFRLYAPPCTVGHWVIPYWEEIIPLRIPPWDAWQGGPGPDPDPGPLFDPETVLDAVLGGIMAHLVARFPYRDLEQGKEAEEVMESIIKEGVQFGLQAVRQYTKDAAGQLRDYSETFFNSLDRTALSEGKGKGRQGKESTRGSTA